MRANRMIAPMEKEGEMYGACGIQCDAFLDEERTQLCRVNHPHSSVRYVLSH
jgi:hypothetical protein